MIIPIQDTIMVKQEQTHKDEMSGFFLDSGFDPTAHIDTTVEVVAKPRGVSKDFKKDIENIEAGDRLVVNWKLFDDSDNQWGQEFRFEDDIYACPIRWVFLIIKPNDEIIPMHRWTLAEYAYPENSKWMDVDGKQVRVVESSVIPGLVTETDVKPLEERALILKEFTGMLEGKVVHHAKHADHTYEVLGEDKLIIERELIYGTYGT